MKAIWKEDTYEVLKTTAKTVTINVDGKPKTVPTESVTIIDEKTAKVSDYDDLEKLSAEYEAENIDDAYDPAFDKSESLQLNVGQSVTMKFLQMNSYTFEEESGKYREVTQPLFRRPQNGYTYHLSGKHAERWFSENGKAGEYYRITRLRDVDMGKGKNPMRSYRYTHIADQSLKAKYDEVMKNAIKTYGETDKDLPF